VQALLLILFAACSWHISRAVWSSSCPHIESCPGHNFLLPPVCGANFVWIVPRLRRILDRCFNLSIILCPSKRRHADEFIAH
jgi:hypothetical protein